MGIGLTVIITIGAYILKTMNKGDKDIFLSENEILNSVENGGTDNEEENKILIHITGSVKAEGVVILNSGDRIIDAIEAAGGEKEDADLSKLNLAYILQDGEKLYVPSINDTEEEVYVTAENGENVITEGAGNTDKVDEKKETVNINTATKEELMTLPGVGESTAIKIIDYRKSNGKFQKIEDIKSVPGIGDSKFQNMKEKLSV